MELISKSKVLSIIQSNRHNPQKAESLIRNINGNINSEKILELHNKVPALFIDMFHAKVKKCKLAYIDTDIISATVIDALYDYRMKCMEKCNSTGKIELRYKPVIIEKEHIEFLFKTDAPLIFAKVRVYPNGIYIVKRFEIRKDSLCNKKDNGVDCLSLEGDFFKWYSQDNGDVKLSLVYFKDKK